MIGLVRDTWRAVLVVVVAIVLRAVLADRPAPLQPVAAAPAMATPMQPWQPPQPVYENHGPVHGNQYPEQRNEDRPLRRIGSAFIELGDSVIGAIRR